ncbi:MAG: phosphoenolpyruvate carboxykinase (ATP) [Bacillota bacterium]
MECFSRDISYPEVLANPDDDALFELCSQEGQRTAYGSVNFVTRVRSRSAGHTYIVDKVELGRRQQPISEDEARKLASEVNDYLSGCRLIRVDRNMGNGTGVKAHCRLFVTEPYARLAYMWKRSLFPAERPEDIPDFVSIYVPEWPERKIFAHPETGMTYILGTDYFGEAKKSFLRMAMYREKTRNRLGFHAASKIIRVKDGQGRLAGHGFLIFGLSGTGKTTLTTHPHDLTEPEGVVVRQDDVVIMDEKTYCAGTENGFFIKTEGLGKDGADDPIYVASRSPRAVFENVVLDENGVPDFEDTSLTGNGRAIIPRDEFFCTDDDIDLEHADNLVFITRRKDILPPVARLSAEQAAAYFMLGESVETSAGDPRAAGQSRREVGTNPFIVGPEAEEGNRLLRFLRLNPQTSCYLLNTGSLGEETPITVRDSAGILENIARDTIVWEKDPHWGYEVPTSIAGVDMGRMRPESYYDVDDYERRVEALRRERRDWLSAFLGLNPAITSVFD